MMRGERAFVRVGLCRADIHAAVELHRIGGDYLPSEPQRAPDRRRAFARRGRSADYEKFCFQLKPAFGSADKCRSA